jgi:hypothetical protein
MKSRASPLSLPSAPDTVYTAIEGSEKTSRWGVFTTDEAALCRASDLAAVLQSFTSIDFKKTSIQQEEIWHTWTTLQASGK